MGDLAFMSTQFMNQLSLIAENMPLKSICSWERSD